MAPGSVALRFLVLFLTSVAIIGCGRTGSVPPLPSRQPDGTSIATLRFTWPARNAVSTHRRRPAYVSPSIASLTISVDGATPIVESAPAPTGSPLTVSYTLTIPSGNHSLLIAEYDAGNTLLGRATQPITIVADVANVIDFTLDGDLAKIAIVPTANPFLEGTLAAGFTLVGDQAQTFAAIPEDADGNRIIAPGAIPPIATTSASSAIVDTDLGNDTFTLYAPAPTAFVTIAAQGTDLNGNAVKTTFQADALAAFYIANYTPQTIAVFDENGTAIATASTAFTGLQNPSGIAYIPAATAGNAGTLAISQTANNSASSIAEFDTAGNAVSLATGTFAGTSEPLFLGYANVAGSPATPTVAVPNENGNTIQLFTPQGTSMALASGAFPNLDAPVQVAYDSHDGKYYVTNLGSSTLNCYTATGTAVGAGVAADYSPMGVAFDSNNNQLYVVTAGEVETPVGGDSTSGMLASVLVYSEAPAAVTEATGAFANLSTTALYTGVVFDPYLKEIFVDDAGDNEVLAYNEAGTAITLPTGAFAKLSDPMAITIVP